MQERPSAALFSAKTARCYTKTKVDTSYLMLSGPVFRVPVKLSVECEVSILAPPEVSVVPVGGVLVGTSEPVGSLSGELHAIAYEKAANNSIFLISVKLIS